MPLDLYITRCPSIEVLLGSQAAACSISETEFNALMQGSGALPGPKPGVFWVPYPHSDEAWLSVSLEVPKENGANSYVLVSIGYGSRRFLRNLGDGLDQSIALASELGARVFEESAHRELTAKNVDANWDPQGRSVKLEASAWKGLWDRVETSGGTPLEWPVGPIDVAPEVVLFEISAVRTADEIRRTLGGLPGLKVADVGPGVFGLSDAHDNQLCVVTRMDSGLIRVRGVHGRTRFREMAPRCAAVAEHLANAYKSQVKYSWHEWTVDYSGQWRKSAESSEASQHWVWMRLPGI